MPFRQLSRQAAVRALAAAGILLAAVLPTSAGPGILAGPAPAAESASARALALRELGRRIFFDKSLSASGQVACSTCHDPAHAYGPPNGLAVQLGGPNLDRQGMRSVPSLRYVLNRTPVWSKVIAFNPAEKILEGDEPPSGGFGWDGRFNTLHDQASFPLLAPNEMANANPEEAVARLQRAAYADEFRKAFGARIFDDAPRAFAAMLAALERFELDDPSFHPYSSRFDAVLEGRAQFTAQEKRGLALFDDPRRGNCATCHLDQKGADGSHPIFTDYQFEALAVPRNPEIAANAAPGYFDLGLCGPLRTDQSAEDRYCGMFKTPTLRNVAARGVFFHNGRFHTLKDALRFYVQRDTDPRKWYPASGSGGAESSGVDKFDDLPAKYRRYADTLDEPLTRKEGDAPAWSDAEIDAVIAFLKTLTDRDVVRLSR